MKNNKIKSDYLNTLKEAKKVTTYKKFKSVLNKNENYYCNGADELISTYFKENEKDFAKFFNNKGHFYTNKKLHHTIFENFLVKLMPQHSIDYNKEKDAEYIKYDFFLKLIGLDKYIDTLVEVGLLSKEDVKKSLSTTELFTTGFYMGEETQYIYQVKYFVSDIFRKTSFNILTQKKNKNGYLTFLNLNEEEFYLYKKANMDSLKLRQLQLNIEFEYIKQKYAN